MIKKEKLLITGASGFIGNYVIKELLKYDKFEIITTARSKEKIKKKDWYDKVTFIEYDLNHRDDNLMDFFNNPDRVIHLAWDGLSNYKSLIHIEENLINSYYFIKNLINNGLKDINCIGTCFEYGIQNGPLSEELITKPSTAYGLGKDTLKKNLEELQKNRKFDFKWIRLFYMYGEGQSEKSLISMLEKAINNKDESFNMSKGDQLRDYLYIEDVAKYIVNISLQSSVTGAINCASGIPISIRNFVEEHLKKKNHRIQLNLGCYGYPDYEPMAFWADITKLNIINNQLP